MTLLSLDTSFIIDFLSGQPSAVDKMRKIESDGVAVSSTVVYELLVLSSGDRKPNKIQKAINIVEFLLSRIGTVWSVDSDAARFAAKIQRTQMVKSCQQLQETYTKLDFPLMNVLRKNET